MLIEAVLGAFAELLVEDRVGGDTFFFDKLLDLLFVRSRSALSQELWSDLQYPESSLPDR